MANKLILALLPTALLLSACKTVEPVTEQDMLVVPAELMQKCDGLKKIEGMTLGDANDYILYLIDADKQCAILNDEKADFIAKAYAARKEKQDK